MAKPTILKTVQAHADALRVLNHRELYVWAKSHNIESRPGFAKFKNALGTIGIDYDELRGSTNSASWERRAAKIEYECKFFSAYSVNTGIYGVCLGNGKTLFSGEKQDIGLRAGEFMAACAAVELAIRVRESLGNDIRLNLFVSADWLARKNLGSEKTARLHTDARKNNIDLKMAYVSEVKNPAYDPGCSYWLEIKDLLGLVKYNPKASPLADVRGEVA